MCFPLRQKPHYCERQYISCAFDFGPGVVDCAHCRGREHISRAFDDIGPVPLTEGDSGFRVLSMTQGVPIDVEKESTFRVLFSPAVNRTTARETVHFVCFLRRPEEDTVLSGRE